MSELQELGSRLGQVLFGALQVRGPALETEQVELRARLRRRDPALVPGSRHFAAGLAYGDFALRDGTKLRCEGIPGIGGVVTADKISTVADGRPQVKLRRILTHFHFDKPSVLIEQNPWKESVGTLTGIVRGEVEALLPGKASFAQFLILTLNDIPMANREPLVMTAERVEEWPPIGSTFVSEAPTDFYEWKSLDDKNAKAVATLMGCNKIVLNELTVQLR